MTTNNLSGEVVDDCTQHFDFGTGYPEEWDIAFPRTERELESGEYEPMMNTLWPLPEYFEIPENIREKLDNMTVVRVDRRHHLALTGGGMDMSWHIARTYVNLGLLPPATLGALPRMAGMDFEADRNREVIEALKESHGIAISRSENSRRKLDDLTD